MKKSERINRVGEIAHQLVTIYEDLINTVSTSDLKDLLSEEELELREEFLTLLEWD